MAKEIYSAPRQRREYGIGGSPRHEYMAGSVGVLTVGAVRKPVPVEVITLPEEPKLNQEQQRELAAVALVAAEVNDPELVDA